MSPHCQTNYRENTSFEWQRGLLAFNENIIHSVHRLSSKVSSILNTNSTNNCTALSKSAREIISLDGCHLNCVVNCLAQHKIEPTHQFTLSAYGIKKKNHVDFSPSDVINIKNVVISSVSK